MNFSVGAVRAVQPAFGQHHLSHNQKAKLRREAEQQDALNKQARALVKQSGGRYTLSAAKKEIQQKGLRVHA